MKWIVSIFCGLLATASMDVAMKGFSLVFGLMPMNIHPAAAFLYILGIENELLPLLLHFSYGSLWAVVYVYAFSNDLSFIRSLQFSVILWLFMMVVYSPIIGWGFFGYGNAGLLESVHPLYLKSIAGYLFITLLVHLLYGAVLGYTSQRLISEKYL
ncbi:MAG: hypothetical protein GVY08_13365 [Bacteroidetes bacterium]|jgi:hypothetical protein|nr:hypothetical protein [Bacteroidota bacterium]